MNNMPLNLISQQQTNNSDLTAPNATALPSSPERYPNRFKPGQSGNPSGRPKRTSEEQSALDSIRKLAPEAVKQMEAILTNPRASSYAKIQVISIILDRTFGRPEAAVKVTTAQQSVESAEARIAALVSSIRIEMPEDENR